jgi:hypothetical protein
MTDLSMAIRESGFKPETLGQLQRWIRADCLSLREHRNRVRAKLCYAEQLWDIGTSWGGH